MGVTGGWLRVGLRGVTEHGVEIRWIVLHWHSHGSSGK